MEEEPLLKPCVVCGRQVVVASDFEGDVLCINDFFTDDPTEEWEADDE